MAQQVVVVEDITGEAGASTRRLRLDGVEYDIDLTEETFAGLQEVLRPYLEKARVVPMSKRGKASGAGEGRGTQTRNRKGSTS